MKPEQHHKLSTHSPSESVDDFDAANLEFIEFINRSGAQDRNAGAERPTDAPVGAQRRTWEPGLEPDQTSTTRSTSDESAISGRTVRRPETQIEELRDALAGAQAQVQQSSEALRDHDSIRQTLASVTANRDTDIAGLREARHREEQARTETDTLRDELADSKLRYNHAEASAEESSRRENRGRAELELLHAELTKVNARHDEAVADAEAFFQRENQARAELATARIMAADHASALEELRQVITERDQEINGLQQHLLQAEQTRAADAAAIQASVQRAHASALEEMRQVITDRDQEINGLQQHLLQAEQTRAADAAAILGSLDKYRA